MTTRRVLVADPDIEHRLLVCAELERCEFSTATARSAEETMAALQSGMLDLVLLEADLPEGGGADCCAQIRAGSGVPIVIYGEPGSNVAAKQAFAAGADDYVAKPLDLVLLLARIQAILRRTQQTQPVATVVNMTRVQAGPLVVDHTAQRASFNGTDLSLSAKELQVLFLLTQHVGKLVSRRHLQESIWGSDVPEESKTLDVHVSRLRKKLDEAELDGRLVKTIRNRGYMLSSAVSG